MFLNIDTIRKKSHAGYIFVQLPYVIRENKRHLLNDNIGCIKKYDGYIVCGYDALSFVKQSELNGIVIAGSHLYSYNNYAVSMLRELNVNINISPYELNSKELRHRDNDRSILTIYGKAPMMISNNCVNKNCISCDHNEKTLTLADKKGHRFPVRNKCNMCYNVIYNDLPTALFDEYDSIKTLG